MSEIDANIIVEGQKTVATIPQEGEIIKDGGEIDATCIVEDSNGKRHKAVKIVNIDEELSDKSEIDAQILNNNNELITIIEEQEGEIIPQDNSEIDFHCLVQKDDGKQLSVKTIELDGEIIKTGGAIETTCVINSNGKKQLAIKVFNHGGGWKGKPADWSDIRKDCPTNSIALYAAHKADYSQYDNLGFSVTCTGGYNVFIDGVQYGSTYASGAQCSITWSTSGITTGDDITTPSAMKAHKIWVEPATEGDNITNFTIKRVAASGTEQQGVLWAHFNLSNSIKVSLSGYNQVNQILQAITSKNNILHASDLALFAYNCPSLTYCTIIDCDNNQVTIGTSFPSCSNIKQISIKNATAKQDFSYTFNNCLLLEKVSFKNVDTSGATNFNHAFNSCVRLKNLPEGLRFDNAQYMTNFLVAARYLNDTVLDVTSATKLKIISCYGTSDRFMSGFKGLRVSDEAPFDNATAPQINVSYTGMDRSALVQLFNDLPTVTGGQIINITGCTGASSLTDDEVSIATNKGWTVTGGPAFQAFATFSGTQVGDTIKLNDGMATSDKNWSAYPSDTAITGDYTQTATVTAVSGDNIECTKPTQDDKTITITTDEDAEIEVVDNTSFNTVTINADQTADIETSASVTTDNNDILLTSGSYHTFKMTVPPSMSYELQMGGTQYTVDTIPYLIKKDTTITLLLKDGNNVYYRNMWKLIKDLRLNYQQINFTYPTGATVTCKVNNVLQSNLTPYCYTGDTVTWTCDNAGTVTTGTYTVKFGTSGNIQTITIS